jgi:heat shock protein HtpX
MFSIIMTATGHAAGAHFGHTGLWVGGLFALSILLALYLPALPDFQRALLAVLCTASAGVAGTLLGWSVGLPELLALAFLSFGAFFSLLSMEEGAMAIAFHSVLASFMMGLGVIGAFLSGYLAIWVPALFSVAIVSSVFFHRPLLRLMMLMAAVVDIASGLFYLMGAAFGVPLGPVVVGLVLAIDADILLYFASDSFILWLNGAHVVTEAMCPRAFSLVKRPAAAAGLPAPRIALVDSEAVNIFSVGRSPGRTVVALTQGLLDRLDDGELEAMLAHELSHVKDRDLLAMTMTCALAAPVGGAMRQLAMDRHRGISLVSRAFIAVVAPFFALLLHLSMPRAREKRADSSAVLLTQNSEALASALGILERHVGQTPMQANPASGPLFAVDPFRDGWLHGLFATHPPTDERIDLLKQGGAPAGAA